MVDANFANIVGICFYAALQNWCIRHPFGAETSCCGSRGCCGSCCESTFDEDDFDERLKKEQGKNGHGTGPEPVDAQPGPSHDMSITATGDPKPTVEEVR